MLHCFTGTPTLARAGLDLGFYISLAGIITFPKAAELRETARARAARPAADRDRQPVSRAGAAPRQAERAGATWRAWSTALARLHGHRRGRARPADDRELPHACSGRDKVLPEATVEKSSLALSQIFEPIRADLEQVEREFARHVAVAGRPDPARSASTSRRAAASASGRPCC